MIKNLPIFIGLRYLRSKRREKFVSFVSGFSLCAMALGVAALIIVLSVMNGFDQEIKSRLLKVVPHVSVVKSDGFSSDQLKNICTCRILDDPLILLSQRDLFWRAHTVCMQKRFSFSAT